MGPLMRFLRHYPTKRFDKGQLIVLEGVIPRACYVIRKGIATSYTVTQDGEESLIDFAQKFDAFPEAWIFHRLEHSPWFYKAFTDCDVWLVPREEYISFIKTHPESLYQLVNRLIGQQHGYQRRLQSLEQPKAIQKILHMLHYLSARFGRPLSGTHIVIRLSLTHQDFAHLLGLTRETVGHELKRLERAGVIHYEKQRYTINREQLETLLEADDLDII